MKNNKIAIIIYLVILALILALAIGFIFKYSKDLDSVFKGEETFEFTAETVKDKAFTRDGGGVTIFMDDTLSLYSSADANVYKIMFKDKDNNTVFQSLPAEDGYVFTHLIALNGATPVWNLANPTKESKTYDLYFTISDGKGLETQDSLYYAKGGQIEVIESEVQVYDTNGNKLTLTGDTENSPKQLGKPYKVSFTLDGGSACVIKSSSNRLCIYGINCRI